LGGKKKGFRYGAGFLGGEKLKWSKSRLKNPISCKGTGKSIKVGGGVLKTQEGNFEEENVWRCAIGGGGSGLVGSIRNGAYAGKQKEGST